MKIKIPFTKSFIKTEKYKSENTCNGNGQKNKTISFSLYTIIGNGDSGERSEMKS